MSLAKNLSSLAIRTRILAAASCMFFLFACVAVGQSPDADSSISPAIVVVGDVHGDFEQLVAILKTAGLINKKQKWTGGNTHLVQMGDIPDRGPDSRKAMDLLMKLEKSAAKSGGQVTVLIGNHEAMMMTNDLRYVHPGEYKAFKDGKSKARRAAYYQQTITHLQNITPADEMPVFDKAYKKDWESRFPLGYVEHRLAWDASGKYGKWVISRPAIAKIGDSLYMHGGLSEKYSAMSVQEINTRARTDLANPGQVTETSIIEDPDGPLWFRGWATSPHTPANEALLDQILLNYGALRMVIAHTPLVPIVLPRFGGKVLMVDVGIAAHYGSGFSALKISGQQAIALIGEQQLTLPNPGEANAEAVNEYLNKAAEIVADGAAIKKYQAMNDAADKKAKDAADLDQPAVEQQ